MLREGTNDTNRFFFHAGLPKQKINNRTSDPFNHIRSVGGYSNSGATIYPNHSLTPVSKGGIVPLAPLPQDQYVGNENSSHPVPLVNALVDYPIIHRVSQLVDKPLPPNLNPIAAAH
jgi:hypothetical protein